MRLKNREDYTCGCVLVSFCKGKIHFKTTPLFFLLFTFLAGLTGCASNLVGPGGWWNKISTGTLIDFILASGNRAKGSYTL